MTIDLEVFADSDKISETYNQQDINIHVRKFSICLANWDLSKKMVMNPFKVLSIKSFPTLDVLFFSYSLHSITISTLLMKHLI